MQIRYIYVNSLIPLLEFKIYKSNKSGGGGNIRLDNNMASNIDTV